MASAPAEAIEFDWSFAGTGVAGAVDSFGTLTTGDDMMTIGGRAAYQVVSIAGQRNGVAITGLRNDFPSDYGGADNYMFLTGQRFTYQGLSYGLADGTYANIYDAGSEIHAIYLGGFYAEVATGQFSLAEAGAVPEPMTWALLAAGFGLVGTVIRRRRTSSVPAYA